MVIGHSVRAEVERCLQALDAHAGARIEVIYVDNDSDDGTVQWLRDSRPDVAIVELSRNLWGSARNYGLARARGRYTMFIDSDAIVQPGAIETMSRALDENPCWGLVAPRLEYPDGTLQRSCRRFPPLALPVLRRPPLRRFLERSRPVRHHLMEDVDPDGTRPVLYTIGACHFFRTAAARELGGMDRHIGWGGCEDVDWCIRWWQAGYEVTYLPDATVVHDYRRASNRSPVSVGALRHLISFGALQWRYRSRRTELKALAEKLDMRSPA